jgi:hypothetical protein
MKIQKIYPPSRDDDPKLKDWLHQVHWNPTEDQDEERHPTGMYPSRVFKGACYCVLYQDGEHLVWTYLRSKATKQFETMKDLVRVGTVEFEDE